MDPRSQTLLDLKDGIEMTRTNIRIMQATKQRPCPEATEKATKTVASESPDHIMPGLIEPLVDAFLTPRQHFTTRGVKRRKHVTETVINSALFHDLYGRMRLLAARVDRIDGYSDGSVRESLHMIRRSA